MGSDRGAPARPGAADLLSQLRIGTAGWSIPRASTAQFDTPGTHLQRYAARLTCAEINSSFHRPHAVSTYAKWRDSTPPDFRFAVKIPRTITHDLKLRGSRDPLVEFLAQSDGLGIKRGPLLVQLPPSLAFDRAVAIAFLDVVRSVYDGPLVCEPRHATWFAPLATSVLERYRVARVAADPPRVPAAAIPGAWPGLTYFRLHGSPRTYWSRYDQRFIASLAATIGGIATAGELWCVFDNTASGSAIENALELEALTRAAHPSPACPPARRRTSSGGGDRPRSTRGTRTARRGRA